MTESLAELKTTQEEQADLVRRYVDEYAALALEVDRIKQRMDWPRRTPDPRSLSPAM